MKKDEIRNKVIGILYDEWLTRSSDRYLYLKFLEQTNPEALNMTARDFIMNTKLPKFSSVSRARRWAQEHFDTLRPSAVTVLLREHEEIEFKEVFNNRQAWNVAIKMPEVAEKGVKKWRI